MAKTKGCINDACEVHKKKIKYKESEEYCPECGLPLSYVCQKCYTPLDKKGKYCVIHQAEWDDRVDQAKKIVGGAVITIGGLAVTILTGGKDIAEHFTKNR